MHKYPGRRFDDDIWILENLSKGRDFDLFLAFWPEENEKVLIKIVKNSLSPEEKLKAEERLLKEASTLEEFWSPLFPKIHDIRRRDLDKALYIISEYFPGTTLKEFVHQEEVLSLSFIEKFYKDLTYALNYLHEKKGIVHLDLSPDNIIVDLDGNFHVIDFESSHVENTIIPLESLRGKAAYLKDINKGEEKIRLTRNFDHYALASTLEMLMHKLNGWEAPAKYFLKDLIKEMKRDRKVLPLWPLHDFKTKLQGALITAGFGVFGLVMLFLIPALQKDAPSFPVKKVSKEEPKEAPKVTLERAPSVPNQPIMEEKVEDKVSTKKAAPKRKKTSKAVQRTPALPFDERFLHSLSRADQKLKECLQLEDEPFHGKLVYEFVLNGEKGHLVELNQKSDQKLLTSTSFCIESLYKDLSYPKHPSEETIVVRQSFTVPKRDEDKL